MNLLKDHKIHGIFTDPFVKHIPEYIFQGYPVQNREFFEKFFKETPTKIMSFFECFWTPWPKT